MAMAANNNSQRKSWMFLILLLFLLLGSSFGLRVESLCSSDCHCHLAQHDIDCRGAGFTSVPQNIPNETVSLDLSENPLSEVSDFPEIEQLKVLRITNFALHKLKSSSLRSLKSLQFLDLSRNLLETIPKDLEAPSLKVLLLSENSLLDFENVSGPILNSPTLQTLDLSHCFLKNLPDGAFSSLPSLKNLNLSNNIFVYLPYDIFYPLSSLSFLDLSDNGLLPLPNTMFQHNQLLSNLNVSHNIWNKTLSYFEKLVLTDEHNQKQRENNTKNDAILISPSIEILDLSSSILNTLNAKSFASLPKLRHLYILNTGLNSIDVLAFKDLIDLETLHISWNRGIKIPGDMFKHNPKLTSLKCPSCSAMSPSLTSTSISYLDISQQQEQTIPLALSILGFGVSPATKVLEPEELKYLPNLSSLKIRKRDLQIIKETAFQGNKLLRVVDLSHGRLRYIPRNIFSSNENITEIILADNILGLSVIEGPIFTPSAAVHLDLSDNMYTKLRRRYFSGLESLICLNLSKNPLFGWEDGTFSELHSLEVLDLSQTHLLHLHPNSFIAKNVLDPYSETERHLHPGDSSPTISNYSFHLIHIQTLKVLNLSNSNVLYLSNNTFSGTPSLEKLILSENSLRTIDFNSFSSHVPNLTYLDLSNNPWRCDCRFAKIRDLWVKQNMEPRNHLVICDRPESLHGHSWDAINGCADSASDARPEKNLCQRNEATMKEISQPVMGQTESSNINGNSYPISSDLNKGDSLNDNKSGSLPLIAHSSNDKKHDSLVSSRFSTTNKSFMHSAGGGVLLGFMGMSVAIILGSVLYHFVVYRKPRNLPQDHDTSELDL